ncbi:MAG: hypothetical protein DRP47_11975, partial [Candidatus Zixiibacteriota bacterium]
MLDRYIGFLSTFIKPSLSIPTILILSCLIIVSTANVTYSSEPYSVRIESTYDSHLGMHEYVDVTLEGGDLNLQGFDLLMVFDYQALRFQSCLEGQIYDSCSWEYFTYRYEYRGDDDPPSTLSCLRVVGMAETNNDPHHPSCYNLESKPFTLFTIDFLVTDDRTYECVYVPVRFYWTDCGDNRIAFTPDDPYSRIAVGISRYVFDGDYSSEITNLTDTFPTFFGAPDSCIKGTNPPTRFVDFCNGGIDIICPEPEVGDMNLNGVSNEIADAVLYINYFVYGLAVFDHLEEQIAQSDVNRDGIPLTIEDLTYQIRIIVGDALPYYHTTAENATITISDTAIFFETEESLGTAHFVFQGIVNPVLHNDNMNILYAYSSDDNATRVLVYNIGTAFFSSGLLLTFEAGAELLAVSVCTYHGELVELTIESDTPTDLVVDPVLPDRFVLE